MYGTFTMANLLRGLVKYIENDSCTGQAMVKFRKTKCQILNYLRKQHNRNLYSGEQTIYNSLDRVGPDAWCPLCDDFFASYLFLQQVTSFLEGNWLK